MTHTKLKMLCFVTVSLMLLFAPFLLDISPDGKAYAMGILGSSSGGGHRSSGSRVAVSDPDNNVSNPVEPAPGSPVRVPEPATLLLFGAGAVGIAAFSFRKKFKKKQ